MEKEKRKFEGVWIPAEIWMDTSLSMLEKVILCEIQSLDRGEGCWRKDEEFAAFLGISTSRFQHILTKLRKKKMVSTVKFDGRRRWIRSSHPIHAAIQEHAALLKTTGQPCYGQQSRPAKNSRAALLKTAGLPHTTYEVKNNNKNTVVGLVQAPTGVSSFGECESDHHLNRLVEKLHSFLVKSRRINPKRVNTKKWVDDFRSLIKDVGDLERVKRVLGWYVTTPHSKYTPRVYSADSFRTKFLQIEDTMERDDSRPADDEEEGEYINGTFVPSHLLKAKKER